MMLPRRRETGRLMGRSRCPPPLTSPKRSHVWNWFCRYYLPVGLTLFLCLSQQCTKKISHHKNTNEDPVNNRLMFSVYGVWFWCSKCVHDWWSCQRQVVGLLGCCFFFQNKHAVLDDRRLKMLHTLTLPFWKPTWFEESSTTLWHQALH